MKSSLIAVLLAFVVCAQPAHEPLQFHSPVAEKNFYLLAEIDRIPELHSVVKSDPVLARIAQQRQAALDNAAKNCKSDSVCATNAFRWTDEQIAEAGQALSAIARIRSWAEGPLSRSGVYIRYKDETVAQAWASAARGMNRILDVYGLGKPARYPAIDSITYEAGSVSYQRLIQVIVAMLQDDRAGLDLFFSTSLKFASELLAINHRDEAGRFEPMETGENAAAYQRIRMVDWSQYPYSAIVVLGSGNDRSGIRLSAYGKLRDEIAARRYRERKAPFVLVSGGYVHPARTEFNEALAMKRDLIEKYGIPAEAILVDPHARHTTTNIRNAARILYRYGVPFEKQVLITTDQFHSASIENASFEKRCVEELGYVPHRITGRITPFDLGAVLNPEVLQIDPQDPLDP